LKNIINKLIILLAGALLAQSAVALSQCPAEVKDCGPNPFFILIAGFSQVCSEKFPENARNYRATLSKMVAENPRAYAKMEADPEFQNKLQLLLRESEKMPVQELRNVCAEHLKDREKPVALSK
jgi:hypothetical protein